MEEPIEQQAEKLSAHGRALWDELTMAELDAPTKVLVLQACRVVDRLDRLEAAIRSRKTWVNIAEQVDYGKVVKIQVQIDSVLAESRQQLSTLTQLLHKLGVGKIESLSKRTSDFAKQLQEIRDLD